MATLRQFLVDQSTMPQGSTVREHLESPLPAGSGGGGGFIYSKEPIQVTQTEILVIAERELISVSDRVPIVIEVERVGIGIDENEILEVTDG